MSTGRTKRQKRDLYCFEHYLAGMHGGFKQAIAHACQVADEGNQAKLASQWPDVMAAFKMPSWDMAPTGMLWEIDLKR